MGMTDKTKTTGKEKHDGTGNEDKLGKLGAQAGSVVDKVAAAPGNLLHKTVATAADIKDKASRAASEVAQNVADHLSPDSGKHK